MPTFPQLSTGVAALFPITKWHDVRTVVNRAAGGSRMAYSDPDSHRTRWLLQARGLTQAEWSSIDAFFSSVQGKLLPFTLLDPTDNLLGASEDLTSGLWLKGSGIQLAPGVTDPFGSTAATTVSNTGGVNAEVRQTIDAPGDYHYCFSMWLRSAVAQELAIEIRAGAAHLNQGIALTSQWRRVFVSGNAMNSLAPQVTFAFTVLAGASVDFFGFQVEPQQAPSGYRKTLVRTGVRRVRFDSDQLRVTARSLDAHDADIYLSSVES